MRLLYCSRDYTTHDLRFVRAVVDAGIDVRYLRLVCDGVPYVAEPLPAGATWVDWQGGAKPLSEPDAVACYLPAFQRAAQEIAPDVIHAGPLTTFGVMAALTRIAPTLAVSWGSDVLVDAGRDAWYGWAVRTALKHADGFFCDNDAVLERAGELCAGALPPHLCIPWGPEQLPELDERKRAAVRGDLGWEGQTVVIATRAWHPGYRVPELVDVFADLASRNDRVRLVLLGDGNDAPAVHERIARRGIGSLVHCPGMVDRNELDRLLTAADVYLCLVPSDGTSISLLEAMAHALPAVVARNPGNAQWVSEDTGALVTGGHSEWVQRLLAIVANRDTAERMGHSARAVVQRRADWPTNSKRLVTFYQEVAAADRGRAARR